MEGKVFLVGAGPGDPELLTLKAVKALGLADVILIDDLVHRGALAHARAGSRVIEVGKRGGCRSTPQAFITRLMVRYARQRKIVVRLKGGDPFIFGRGGEELLAMAQAGVPCEVISGISAGIAAPTAAGIALTHRGLARGVTFITGHGVERTVADWRALAQADTTLVVFMGLRRAREIADALMKGGLAPSTPAACISHGTLATQREVLASLAGLADAVERAELPSPSVLVIGEVVGLAQSFQQQEREAAPASAELV
jgi:uroporphyrin-III C-methyltransferase